MAACAAPAGAQPVVAVQTCNLAAVPELVLRDAQARVGTMFQAAGVTVEWIDQSVPVHASRIRLTLLLVHYTSKQPVGANALGMAIEPPTGLGRLAYAFWDRIREHALKRQRTPDIVLAVVMAHELGHLLLPRYSHSSRGLMSDHANDTVLRDAARGRLGFTVSEVGRIRERLLREDAIQQARTN
jgi:hypothetical protein